MMEWMIVCSGDLVGSEEVKQQAEYLTPNPVAKSIIMLISLSQSSLFCVGEPRDLG